MVQWLLGGLLLVGVALWLAQSQLSLANSSLAVHLPLLGGKPAPLANVAARHGIRMGVAVDPAYFANDPTYGRQVRAEFNSVTPEVVMKAQWIHPCPPTWLRDKYPVVEQWVSDYSGDENSDPGVIINCRVDPSEWNWGPMDEVVAWARLNRVGVYGHALLWHSQNPGWLTHRTLYDPFTGDYLISEGDMRRLVTEHITAVVARYCDPTVKVDYAGHEDVPLAGVVYAYDVVNEAVALNAQGQAILQQGTIHKESPARPSRNPWLALGADSLTGENYVRVAFQAARDARTTHCPPDSVRLFYNDFDIETGGAKTEGVFRLLDSLDGSVDQQRAADSPVEGIGFQSHLRLYPETSNPLPHDLTRLQPTFAAFADGLGLEIKITEADVSLRRARGVACGDNPGDSAAQDCSLPAPATYFAHPTPARSQAHVFAALARACRDTPACTGFTVWGISDTHSWLNCFQPQLFVYGPSIYCGAVTPTPTATAHPSATATPIHSCGCQGTTCPPEESLACQTLSEALPSTATPLGAPHDQRVPPFTPKPAYDALYQVWATPPATAVPLSGYPAPVPLMPPSAYP